LALICGGFASWFVLLVWFGHLFLWVFSPESNLCYRIYSSWCGEQVVDSCNQSGYLGQAFNFYIYIYIYIRGQWKSRYLVVVECNVMFKFKELEAGRVIERTNRTVSSWTTPWSFPSSNTREHLPRASNLWRPGNHLSRKIYLQAYHVLNSSSCKITPSYCLLARQMNKMAKKYQKRESSLHHLLLGCNHHHWNSSDH